MSRQKPGEASASPTRATGRWSARRKVSVVLELLRGADLESVSRRHGVTAATISEWREAFLAGGEAHLKAREVAVEDDETRRLKNVVAAVATEKDLLKEKIRHLEASGPLGWWRSKR
jgi:transposase